MQALIENIKNSGFTLEMIEKRTGIRMERLNAIANGTIEPNMGEVRKISKVLKVSTDFLVSNDKYEEINILFRQAITNERQKQKADIISYMIGNAFSLIGNNPVRNDFIKGFPELDNSFKNARLLAGLFRQSFYQGDFLNPILDLPRLVTENLNCILFVTDLGNDTDGASAIIKGIPFIFISPRFEPRMLFTLAHELAHIISHHGTGNFAKIDQHISELGRNKFKDEQFANAFASELLLPEEAVGSALQSLRRRSKNTGPIGDIEIIYLSRFYGVSFEVAAKRCEDVDLLPYGGAVSLSEKLKKEFGSAEKRADELGIPERPKIVFPKVSASLIQSAIDKINSGEMSIGKASEILSIPIADLLKKNVSNK